MYIYKDITNTQWDISFSFLVCFGLQGWLKGWRMSVYALIVQQNDLSATVCCCTDVLRRMTWFLQQRFRTIVLKLDSVVFLCILICFMVVFWTWFTIGLHRISQISDSCRIQMCGFVWSRKSSLGCSLAFCFFFSVLFLFCSFLSHGEPASLVQSFHVNC